MYGFVMLHLSECLGGGPHRHPPHNHDRAIINITITISTTTLLMFAVMGPTCLSHCYTPRRSVFD